LYLSLFCGSDGLLYFVAQTNSYAVPYALLTHIMNFQLVARQYCWLSAAATAADLAAAAACMLALVSPHSSIAG
jgi:hypothetical protein